MTNAVSNYDFTVFTTDEITVKKLLTTYCKKWDFQEEIAPTTGNHHMQGRMKLKVKERLTGVEKKFPGWHLSITSTENVNNNYYVTKEDTRIRGPWSSSDVEIYIPRQVREIVQLHPWQDYILKDRDIWDTRHINIIIDTKGNIGKSTLVTYGGCKGLSRKIPYSNDFRDIMRMVMDAPTSKLYLFDLPKALKKEHLYQFFAGVEEIKNGYAYDDRYSFKEKYFDCPNIWIFTNTAPDRLMLSADRWRFWQIDDQMNLVPLND